VDARLLGHEFPVKPEARFVCGRVVELSLVVLLPCTFKMLAASFLRCQRRLADVYPPSIPGARLFWVFEPVARWLGFVGRQVVEDSVEFLAGRHVQIDEFEEP